MKKSNPKRMKEKTSSKSKKLVVLLIIIILIAMAVLIVKKIDTDRMNLAENEIQPVIYYSYNDTEKTPLTEDDTVVASDTTIMWLDNCSGVIKKDGKEFSKGNNVILVDDGIYEITVTSASKKLKTTKTVRIDKTPPKVDVKKNASGSYTITFADVNDIGTATLTRLDTKAETVISEIDLTQGGLQKSIEINEAGYYLLKVTDKLGNVYNEKTKFLIQ